MDDVAESATMERSPRVRTRFSLDVENERADAGQDASEPVSRDQSSGANKDRGGGNPFSVTTSRNSSSRWRRERTKGT